MKPTVQFSAPSPTDPAKPLFDPSQTAIVVIDLQLRRRGITTIVLCGIASGLGVDTTACEAFQLGYEVIFAIDAMTGFSEAEHAHVRDVIFPRIGRIRETSASAAVFGDGPAAPPA